MTRDRPAVVITAGATIEPLDPVRFITNRSSGKMGVCLLREALRRGYPAVFIHGLLSVPLPTGTYRTIHAPTAKVMLAALRKTALTGKILIMAAAVADFRPLKVSKSKIKRTPAGLTLRLVPNPDLTRTILRETEPLFTVGFAAETGKMLSKGAQKMKRKGTDLMVANDIGGSDAGFGSDHSRAALILPDGRVHRLGRTTKQAVASRIFDEIEDGGLRS